MRINQPGTYTHSVCVFLDRMCRLQPFPDIFEQYPRHVWDVMRPKLCKCQPGAQLMSSLLLHTPHSTGAYTDCSHNILSLHSKNEAESP